MVAVQKTLAQEKEDIFARLQVLSKMDFPHYRTYKQADGTWVDREPVPEYLEQEELIRRWNELRAIERFFDPWTTNNPLIVSLRLSAPIEDASLQYRIAKSVYENDWVRP